MVLTVSLHNPPSPVDPKRQTNCKQRNIGIQSNHLSLARLRVGSLGLRQDALFPQLVRTGASQQPFLQAVGPHVQIQLLLVALQRRRNIRVGQDVALHEIAAVGSCVEAPFQIVRRTLALEFEGFGLESAGGVG